MRELESFVVSVTDTVKTAMEKITRNLHRVVIVVDGRTVVGTVSDGDIRRAFLNEILPIAPVEKIMNVNCVMTTETDPAIQKEIVRREKVTLLPVVSGDNELIDVVTGYEPFAD